MASDFTSDERDVALLLLQLQDHVDYRHDLLAGLRGWGFKKFRSVLRPHEDAGDLFRRTEDACSVGDFAASASAVTLSPATPLSFPGSCEDNDAAVPVKPVAKAKNHKQFVEQQNCKIASLSQDNAYLKRIVEQYKSLIEDAAAKNALYRKAQQILSSKAAARIDWTSFDDDGRPETTVVGPTVDCRGGGQPAKNGGNIGMLDLNVVPTEEVEEIQCHQVLQVQHQNKINLYVVENKAAKSALARKRRLEIQKEKNLKICRLRG